VEESFGIIPLVWRGNHWEVLLVHHHAGHWAFPKGHPEGGEEPRQSAERELREETGLTVTYYLSFPPLHERYTYERDGQAIDKQVTYFLAEVEGVLTPQPEEVGAAEWFFLADADSRISFPEGQELCQKVVALLATYRKE
jgi:bis(5'-nucleosidyl)-tetraphosphatase